MSERRPYSRVYWSIRDDARFRDVFMDDPALALWLRLLMTADAVWPSAADLPRYVKSKPLGRLVDAGIVDLVGDHAYRVHGLDKEREFRKQTATTRGPNGDRTVPRREANGNLDEIRQDETSTRLAETPRDAADIYWNLTGRYPAGKALDWIDNLASTYGHESTVRALVKAQGADKSVSDLLSRTQDTLRAEARKLDIAERESEAARLREKRAVPRAEEPWRAEFRDAIRRQYEEGDAA